VKFGTAVYRGYREYRPSLQDTHTQIALWQCLYEKLSQLS